MKKNDEGLIKTERFLVLSTDVDIRAVIRANIGSGGVRAVDLDRVKMPTAGGGTWTVPTLEGDQQEKELTGLIVGWQDVRAYWAEAFTGSQPPDCASLDCVTGIGQPGGACKTCPYAAFGSAQGGAGAGQACKQIRRLLILQEGAVLPMMLSLPPTSLKAVRQYFIRLAAAQIPYYGAVSCIGLERAQNVNGIAYSRATFAVARLLTLEEAGRTEGYVRSLAGALTAQVGAEDYDGKKEEA